MEPFPRAASAPEPMVIPIEEGTQVRIRPLGPVDEEALAHGLAHLSSQSSYQRFLSVRHAASTAELHYLSHPDQRRHLALAAETVGLEEDVMRGVGVARSIYLPGSEDMAEYAVAVRDAFQGMGLGALLLRHLAAWAYETGIRRWYGTQLAGNHAVVRATSQVAREVERRPIADGVVEVFWELHPPESSTPSTYPSTGARRE